MSWHRYSWCRKRMGWIRWLIGYRRCTCPPGVCRPTGEGGVVETRGYW